MVNRSLAVTGSRTFTAGAEFHRPQSTRAVSLVWVQSATAAGSRVREATHNVMRRA